MLPRILDKCRATVAGRHGEYKYGCPMDQRWLEFAGIDAEALKAEVALGRSDSEILAWITANSRTRPGAAEIASWSAWLEARSPGDIESRAYFHESHNALAPQRSDVATWFDLLDLDDFASFGGRP